MARNDSTQVQNETDQQEGNKVLIYGFYGSFCTQKVYLALAEKGVKHIRQSVNIGPPMENYKPWYARINPRMVVPTLQYQNEFICDSAKIIRYIDTHFDGPPLMPQNPAEHSEVDDLINRIDRLKIRELSYGNMRGALSVLRDRVIMPRRLRKLRKYKEQAPELAEIYEERIKDIEKWIQTIHKPDDLSRLKAELNSFLTEIEAKVENSSFVVSNTYTLADLMVTVLCARLQLLGITNFEHHPSLLAHYKRMKKRPNFPRKDIVETFDKRKAFKIMAPFLLPRIAIGIAVLGLIILAIVVIK